MNVILSNSLITKFDTFEVIDDCSKLEKLSDIEVLVIHDTNIDDWDVGLLFPKWINMLNIKMFLYINPEPAVKITMLVNSVNGMDGIVSACYTDDFYLDNEEDLLILVDELRNGTSENEVRDLISSSGGIVHDFCRMVAKGDERAKTNIVINQAKEAIDDIINVCINQLNAIKEMDASALEIFERAGSVIDGMSKQNKLLKEQLAQLEASSMGESTRPVFSNSVLIFPTYKYSQLAKVLYIREYAPCRYLTSFLVAYQHYLHYSREKRVKLVFVVQRGPLVSKRYDDIPSISPESEKLDSLYESEIIVTNNPKESVLRKLFEQNDDVYIIVDRLYQKQPILSGRIKQLNAVSGDGDLDRYNIGASNTIFSIDTKENGVTLLRKIQGFPTEKNAQYSAYYKFYKDTFLEMDKMIGFASTED